VHNSLEQDTDIVFFLHSDFLSGVTQDREGRSTEGYVELINRKWRNFKLGETKKLRFNGKLMQFTDMDESEQFLAPKGFVKVENLSGQFDDDF
jgi:replicative DNA helicase